MTIPNEPKARIRHFNDVFRGTFTGGRITLTEGVRALDDDSRGEVLTKVREFDAFTKSNDPHDEHDFGAFEVGGVRYFWKIAYYDEDCRFASHDPANPKLTTRLLTIMRADEY